LRNALPPRIFTLGLRPVPVIMPAHERGQSGASTDADSPLSSSIRNPLPHDSRECGSD
jgi:hypothetical protein